MQSHKIEWREQTVEEYLHFIRNGIDLKKPFPFKQWLISVDGVPIAEVDVKTRLMIMTEVMHFLDEVVDTSIQYSTQHMNGDGSSSSESVEDTIESSTET